MPHISLWMHIGLYLIGRGDSRIARLFYVVLGGRLDISRCSIASLLRKHCERPYGFDVFFVSSTDGCTAATVCSEFAQKEIRRERVLSY
jgi:hypothetical protein